MKVIGLTGGIGSGKSRFAEFLSELGAVVINADRLGHEALKPGTGVWRELVAAFGEAILNPAGEVDRRRLAEIVFADGAALEKLNRITHPRIFQMVQAQLEEQRQRGTKVVVVEAPLLLEAGWLSLIDEVWVVVASEATVLKRLKERGGLSVRQARARMRVQMPDAERLKRADVVVNNDGSPGELEAIARKLWERLTGT
ncbi:MAG: dephospho-CoA kinase [Chloroflexota bacterium]